MPNRTSQYYYIDIDLSSQIIVSWGETDTANLTGETGDPNIFRVFLTRGQYHKLANALKKKSAKQLK